jgi:hypothetical protein
MQDLDVSHEEFLDRNDELALPNLGFKFFVGNSLVGEHDPTRIDVGSYQETLTGGLKSTLDEIHETRSDFQTAHGDEKDELGERLEDLTEQLETQLAVKGGDDWMNEVAEEAGSTFAWTSKIPEVILEGGFDIVIGNPPYEGQSQQDYVGELARFYDKKYDFYKTIPRMRHDLYQKFNIRGWELTAEGGVLSYITSNTFYTIGSKQTTRHLLQDNELCDLVCANPETFDAAVNPAIFTIKKSAKVRNYSFNYIDASGANIDEYRSLIGEASKVEANDEDTKSESPVKIKFSSETHGYRVPVDIYRKSLRRAFFEPTVQNMKLYQSVISNATRISAEWEDEIRDSDTLDANINVIREQHLKTLQPGDVSILGLLTVGGQGLSTGSNDDYLAYLDGTPEAEKVKERNDEFAYRKKNDNQYKWMSRVIRPDDVVNVDSMSLTEREEGIDNESKSWVPIIKGKGDPYYTPITQYIDWSKDSISGIRKDGLIRNKRYYFEEGIFISRGGTGKPVIRYSPPAAVDSSGGIYIPTYDQVSAKFLNGLLNSTFIQHLINCFINGTVNTQIQDMRLVPIVIPTDEQLTRMERLVDEAISIRVSELNAESTVAELDTTDVGSSRTIADIEADIDELVSDIYDS